MTLLWFALFVSPFVGFGFGASPSLLPETFSACYLTELIPSPVTELLDLRTPTAFTYADALSIYNCSLYTYTPTPNVTDQFFPTTTWMTADISGTLFPAQNSYIAGIDAPLNTITTTTTIYESYTFPAMTVTSLTQGEAIRLSWAMEYVTVDPTTYTTSASGWFNIFVPTNALTLPTATSASTNSITNPIPPPSPTPSPSQTPSPSSTPASTSVNVGAIAGGVIGGFALLGAIIAFALYKLRKPHVQDYGEQGGSVPVEKPNYGYGNEDRHSSLRYPESSLPSANTGTGVHY